MLLVFLFLLIKTVSAMEPFCGWSTYSPCSIDSDCQASGCNNQVCERVGENTITTCEFRECYSAEKYGLTCQCINKKCQWGYSNKTPYREETSDSKVKDFVLSLPLAIPQIRGFIISLPLPIFLLVFGIILLITSKFTKFIATILIVIGLILLLIYFF